MIQKENNTKAHFILNTVLLPSTETERRMLQGWTKWPKLCSRILSGTLTEVPENIEVDGRAGLESSF